MKLYIGIIDRFDWHPFSSATAWRSSTTY